MAEILGSWVVVGAGAAMGSAGNWSIIGLCLGIHAVVCFVFNAGYVWRLLSRQQNAPSGAGIKRGCLAGIPSLLVLMVLPMMRPMHASSLWSTCRDRLGQIGLALSIYSNDNGGWAPSIEPKVPCGSISV